jgi:hypothetical protein
LKPADQQVLDPIAMANNDGERRVTLRNQTFGADRRMLWAVLTPDGDLRIEGQDLGPAVAEIFGEGLTEYEWDVVVRAANLPRAVVALGGAPGDDVLALLAQRYSGFEASNIEQRLDEAGVPSEFWSRIGD